VHDVRRLARQISHYNDASIEPRIVRPPLTDVGKRDVSGAAKPFREQRALRGSYRPRWKSQQDVCRTVLHAWNPKQRSASTWFQLILIGSWNFTMQARPHFFLTPDLVREHVLPDKEKARGGKPSTPLLDQHCDARYVLTHSVTQPHGVPARPPSYE
jgi:hypothetical protein